MDASSPDVAALLHGHSVYLDGSIQPTDLENIEVAPNTNDLVTSKSMPEVKKRKKVREEKAKRLAAEQAIWVRQKFDLPASDNLIASFSAALVKSILLQGRIHITTSCLCFYAKIFGRITKEAFHFSSLARVKKRKGGFVANAIKIYFLDDTIAPVVIGSLNHRERAFNIIQARLREVNPSAAEKKEAEEAGSNASAVNSHRADSEEQSFEEMDLQSDALGAQPCDDNDVSLCRSSCDADPRRSIDNFENHLPLPPLVWRTSDDVVDRVHGKASEKKSERARGTFNAPIKEVFNILFVSHWLEHYHESTKNHDVTFTDWYRGTDSFMEREVNFRKPLAYKIGPKETRVKEMQRYSFTEQGGVLIELEGHNIDAPYGDYFVCESYFELIPQGNDSTLFIASLAVHFNKSTILKGKIESAALAETKTAFCRLYELASSRVEEHIVNTRGLCAKSQKRTKSIGQLPVSPTKRMRANSNLNNYSTRGMPPSTTADRSANPTASPTDAPVNSLDVGTRLMESLEITDSSSIKGLRIAAIVALIAVCVLLVCVLILLTKMRSDVSALERLVAEARIAGATRCAAESVAPSVSC